MTTASFSDEHLDDDYKSLCIKLIGKMSRKRNVPFVSGRIENWVAAIVYALGSINFLFDKSFKPYVSSGDISSYFGVSKSTTSQKAKVIKDMFKLHYFDSEFSTQKIAKENPMNDLVMINDMVVSMRVLPPEVRENVESELQKKSTGKHKRT